MFRHSVTLAWTALLVAVSGVSYHAGAQQNQAQERTETKQTAQVDTTKTASVMTSRSTGKPYGYHLEPILKTVNASPEQRKSITQISAEFRARIEPLKVEHEQLRDQFLKSLTSSESGESVMAKESEFNRVHSALAAQYLAMRLKVQKVLTPEQVVKLQEYRKRQGWK